MLEAHGNYMAVNDTIIDDNVLVETPLTYPGGEPAICAFINKNTEYPLIALNKNIQGEVVVTVRIEKDGKVGDVTIMKGLSRECDQAVVDAVRKLKRFIPAKQNGIPIPSGVWLPASFKIEKKHGRLSGKVSANYQDVIIGWEGICSLTGDNICINVPVSYDCSSSLSYWIARKTQYPHKALCNDTQGDAVVEFCVKEDGTIDEVSMLKSLSPECDQALMDAVHKIKRIAPTKEAGKPTPVWLKVPVSFKIEKDKPEISPVFESSKEEAKGENDKATETTKVLSNTITKIQKVSGKIIVEDDIEWSYSPFNSRKNRK